MSRSYKKAYVKFSESNKKDKTFANRLFRKLSKLRTRLLINENVEDTDEDPDPDMKLLDPPVKVDEVMTTYDFSSDGLAQYVHKTDYMGNEVPEEKIKKYKRK